MKGNFSTSLYAVVRQVAAMSLLTYRAFTAPQGRVASLLTYEFSTIFQTFVTFL